MDESTLKMTEKYTLERGKKYTIIDFSGNSPIKDMQITYVRKETLPKTGRDWETFYFTLGDTFYIGAESGVVTGALFRVRIPIDKIKRLEGNKVSIEGGLVQKTINEDRHLPIVDEWMQEVKKVMQGE